MCGRYTVRRINLIRSGFGAMPSEEFDEFTEKVNPFGLFNIAPSQRVPVIRLNRDGNRVVRLAKWGLIPSWTKGKPQLQPINAKCETAATSAMFRQPMERRRCLVPADGFYEWQGAAKPKQPYFIRVKDDDVFAFAGLWERWMPDEQSGPIDTFTILTTGPNELMQPIHNRMPVILDQSAFDRWLDRNSKPADVAKLLKPFPAERMEAWPVQTRVNSPANDGPELIEPLGDADT